MCGRTACTLAPDIICQACTVKGPDGTFKKPEWKEHPTPKNLSLDCKYYPSVNASPTTFTPVMYKPTGSDFTVTPMMFGMIPCFHQGNPKSHKLSTNNCRIEGVLTSRLYKRVLDQRKLCVVIAQGFYEWQKLTVDGKQTKQPYLLFMPQDDDVKIAENSSWQKGQWSAKAGRTGPKILKMAGLYDLWKSPDGDEVLSYSVITMGASKALSWLHERMPAVLETEEQVQAWLNATPNTDVKELLSILKPVEHLQWYKVDQKVGNSRCHDDNCMQPLEEKKKVSSSKSMMQNWLIKSPGKAKSSAKEAEHTEEAKHLKKDEVSTEEAKHLEKDEVSTKEAKHLEKDEVSTEEAKHLEKDEVSTEEAQLPEKAVTKGSKKNEGSVQGPPSKKRKTGRK